MQGKIEGVKTHYIKIPLTEKFVISQNSRAFLESTIIEIHAEGMTGFGEAVPSKYVMNETIEGTLQFAKTLEELIKGKSIFKRNEITKILKGAHAPHCIMNAVNSALIDLTGKLLNVPAYVLFGGENRPIKTSATLSIGTEEETLKSAEHLLKTGFKALKVKVGLNVEEDIKRIKALRHLSDDFDIYTDANQGYDAEEAVRFANAVKDCGVLFVEQPVKAYDIASLKYVKHNSPVPVMADEAAKTPQDAENIIMADAADYINIKLTKAGGIDEAIKIAHITESAYKKAMVGCMLGTPLLIAASFTVFNSTESTVFADLDGFLTLSENPIVGGTYLKDGFLHIYPGNGLAVEKLNL